MYLTILNYDVKNEVLTYKLPSFAAKFQCEDMEEFIDYTLGVDINNCDWMVHEELPEMTTIMSTNEDE